MNNKIDLLKRKLDRDIFGLNQTELNEKQKRDMHKTRELAQHFLTHLSNFPTSREMALAVTKLEECVMWTNKGIALSTKDKPK